MNSGLQIRTIAPKDEQVWRHLWQQYCDFYGVVIERSVTDITWSRLMDAHAPVHAIIAEARSSGGADQVIGFATYVLHPYTWGTGLVCYLEDLFVAEAARGKGAGAALISRLIDLGKENGWDRLYWNTHESNETARALYDRFTPVDPFVRYLVKPREFEPR